MPPNVPVQDPENGAPTAPAASAPPDEEELEGTGANEEDTSQEPLDDGGDEEQGGEGAGEDELTRAEREAEEAAKAAEREALRAEVRREIEREAQERERKAQEQAERARLERLYPTTVKTIRDGLRALSPMVAGEDGVPRPLTDEEIEATVLKHVADLNSRVFDSVAIQVFGTLPAAAQDLLPADASAKLIEEGDQKPIGDWLKLFGEHYAEHSEWAKAKAKEHEAAVKAAEARGQRIGRGLPPDQPSQADGRQRAPAKTWAQLQAGYGAGTLTDAEEARYLEMLAEREKR
jgi:hypothetical protein